MSPWTNLSAATVIGNFSVIQMDFGDKSAILIEKLIAIPYENLKSNTVHEILLEGQIFKLHEKKHYRFI